MKVNPLGLSAFHSQIGFIPSFHFNLHLFFSSHISRWHKIQFDSDCFLSHVRLLSISMPKKYRQLAIADSKITVILKSTSIEADMNTYLISPCIRPVVDFPVFTFLLADALCELPIIKIQNHASSHTHKKNLIIQASGDWHG